jgi:hypothetical protein
LRDFLYQSLARSPLEPFSFSLIGSGLIKVLGFCFAAFAYRVLKALESPVTRNKYGAGLVRACTLPAIRFFAKRKYRANPLPGSSSAHGGLRITNFPVRREPECPSGISFF